MLYLLEGVSIFLIIILIGLFIKHMNLKVDFNKIFKKHGDEKQALKEEIKRLQLLIREYQINENDLLEEIRKYERGEYKEY